MKNKQKTYNVIWTEKLSVNIQATSEKEAQNKILECEHDETQVSTKLDSSPEAYLININN